MTPEIGQFALTLALAVAIVQSILPIVGASTGRVLWMESAKTTAVLQVTLVAIAFGALMRSFVVSDFTEKERQGRGASHLSASVDFLSKSTAPSLRRRSSAIVSNLRTSVPNTRQDVSSVCTKIFEGSSPKKKLPSNTSVRVRSVSG